MAGSAAGTSTTADRAPPPPPLPPRQPDATSSAAPTVDHTAGMSDADVMAAAAGMFPGGMAGLEAMSGNVPLHQRVAAAHTASRSAHTPGAVVPPAGPVPSYDPYNPTDPGLIGPMPTEDTSVPGPPGPPVSSLPSVQGAPVRMGRILAVRPGGMADVVIDSTNELRPVVIANADRVHFEPGDSVRVAGWIAHVVR